MSNSSLEAGSLLSSSSSSITNLSPKWKKFCFYFLKFGKQTRRLVFLFQTVTIFCFFIMITLFFISTPNPDLLQNNNARQLTFLKDLSQDSKTSNRSCKNTIQGKLFLTDDQGYICSRKDIDISNGCCLISSNATKRFDCNLCDLEFSCCKEYEFCVSCCLSPENRKLLEELENKSFQFYKKLESTFDLCKTLCRTSSKSVLHENTFRSNFKYCFGTNSPPLKP